MNIGTAGFIDQSGEKAAVNFVLQKLQNKKDLVIFDVGANIGKYSLLLHETFGARAKIYSFEPSEQTYSEMMLNVSGVPTIQPFNLGLGNQRETVTLYKDSPHSPIASVYKRDLEHAGIDLNIAEQIQLTTLDEFCQDQSIRYIDYLKLDVEGHELKVLQGAESMLAKGSIDFIQFEFGGCNISSRTFFIDFYQLLHKDYHIYRIVKDGLFEITRYLETYEVFDTTNFLAKRRNGLQK